MAAQKRLTGALKSITQVAAGNLMKVFAGVLAGFLLPKLLGVTEYSFFKTCTLYAVYVGLLSTGLVDGIALHWGGQDAEAIDKPVFRCAARLFLLLELGFAAVGMLIAAALPSSAARMVMLYLSVFLLANNITAFFQTLAQCTRRFGMLSRLNMLQSLFTILSVAALWLPTLFGGTPTAVLYLVLSTAGGLIVTLIWLIRSRSFVFGSAHRFREEKPLLLRLIAAGTPLMIANLCSLLMLSIDRQFVNVLCSEEVYANYAFAYNIVTMLTMVISAVATVLYPMLKRSDPGQLGKNLFPLCAAVVLTVAVCLPLFYPLALFIPWFLPSYTASLSILRMILPGLLLSSVTTIVLQSYCMTLGLTLRFCMQGLIMLVISFLADLAAWHWFGTPEAISAASVITLALWCPVTAWPVMKHFHVRDANVPAAMLACIVGFYASTSLTPLWLGFIAEIGFSLAAAWLLLPLVRQLRS